MGLARVALRLDRVDEAQANLTRAREIAEELGDRLLTARTLSALGEIAERTGDRAAARKSYEDALQIFGELDARREYLAMQRRLTTLE